MIGYQPVERWRWQRQDVRRGIRRTWRECVDKDMETLGLHSEWAVFRDVWRDLICVNIKPDDDHIKSRVRFLHVSSRVRVLLDRTRVRVQQVSSPIWLVAQIRI